MKRTLLSLLLCLSMVLTMLPARAFAADEETYALSPNTDGLCEHHPEHDESCGCSEGTAEAPCLHEHIEDCYILVPQCVHEHTEECCPAESASENAASPSEAESAAPAECIHECTEESGCITQILACRHEHDGDCGYAPAAAGTPCSYVCEICNSKDSAVPKTPSKAVSLAASQAVKRHPPSAAPDRDKGPASRSGCHWTPHTGRDWWMTASTVPSMAHWTARSPCPSRSAA